MNDGYDAVRVPPNDWRSNCWGKPFMDGAQSDPTMKRIAAVAHRCLQQRRFVVVTERNAPLLELGDDPHQAAD
jgi:hypothetical protein